jgi:recombination protein RecR
MDMPEPLSNLVNHFARLPGIGPKSARRLAFYLLSQSSAVSLQLAQSIQHAKEQIMECNICHNLSDTNPCPICTSTTRDSKTICVVAKISDIYAFENGNMYKGHYHVLGGYLSPLDGIGPAHLHIPQLIDRIQQQQVQEVILALGSSADAESTALYIDHALGHSPVKRSRLARGIPMGSDLEYLDELTVLRAFEGRISL